MSFVVGHFYSHALNVFEKLEMVEILFQLLKNMKLPGTSDQVTNHYLFYYFDQRDTPPRTHTNHPSLSIC